ncbi:HAD family hydrolase [Bradyrhizobium barranii subsp. apii]|uniref:D,D-heptose 1,7-bisphosphate phosphatase n=1 Tax=Bradyrhizobium barranii subsp. apii TaxID=2819348 RepID=A0A8T5VHQ4_9BRAD|nr:HAD family hydrolase [Bradyrhizobium barranii]UPT88640.1 HAD family hydrolase [Bradyrhizobium barranii subsp. apii]
MTLQRALFLDRDGVINHDTGYCHRPEDFVFRDGIFDLCAAAVARGMALVVVTNQAGIGRGYYTETDFLVLTRWMQQAFTARGIALTGVEFCPDHPTHGIGPYQRENPRRKPSPGMIVDACVVHRLDPARSVMLGDRATDMQAGQTAGVGTLLLMPAEPAEVAAAPAGTVVLPAGDLRSAIAHLGA